MSDTSNTPTGGVEYDETDDNNEDAVLIDDPTYVGTDTIYKNSAYEINKPMLTEPDSDEEGNRPGVMLDADGVREAEELAQQTEEDHAFEVDGSNPRQTWRTDTAHPSEAKNQSDEALKNRARLDEEARQEVRNGTATEQTSQESESDESDEEEAEEQSSPSPFA